MLIKSGGGFFCFVELTHVRTHCCGFCQRRARPRALSSSDCCNLKVPICDYEKILLQIYACTEALALETGEKAIWAAGSLTTSVLGFGRFRHLVISVKYG